MMNDNGKIKIYGAAEHNLKHINVEIPRNSLTVITGLSGSGKSSLAFDTIYAEGQRRYVESLSAYARQFLDQMHKPIVDYIEGLSPAISIEQKSISKNPRSTVGTVTEIYDYLRLLFANIGVAHCYQCGRKIERQTVQQIVDHIMSLPEKTKILVLAPIIRGRKGEYTKCFEEMQKEGFVRVKIDGKIYNLDEDLPNLEKNKKHEISIVVDRLIINPDITQRLTDSIELSLKKSEGLVTIDISEYPKDYLNNLSKEERKQLKNNFIFSEHFSCPECGISIEEITPRMFSFNNPYGACPACNGLGNLQEIDEGLVIPDPTLSIDDGAIAPYSAKATDTWRSKGGETTWYMKRLESIAKHFGFSMEVPFNEIKKEHQKIILYGTNEKIPFKYHNEDTGVKFEHSSTYEGVIPQLKRRLRETESEYVRNAIMRYVGNQPCPECGGKRLKKETLAVKIHNINITDFTNYSIKDAYEFIEKVKLTKQEKQIGEQVIKEIKNRLDFLKNVGLDYLTLDRKAGTISGGEAQRIRLATQIGSQLVGVLYILDEPSIGLHQRDNARLIDMLTKLRDLGNTVIVVEHDEATIRQADYVIDLGPGAGRLGGEIVAEGTPSEIEKSDKSLTGAYLSGRKKIPLPEKRRKANKKQFIEIVGASENNLKKINAKFPLRLFICITGVSGSGKSTLVNETLYKALAREINGSNVHPGKHDKINGLSQIDKVINVDQSPIGRTPRSNPATYTGAFDQIRQLFAQLPDSKLHGYKAGRFSFNVKGGRCEACTGDGIKKIEMHFLPDVFIECDECKGRRFNRETLDIKYKGKNIYEVLEMTVDDAYEFFINIPTIKTKLKTLREVGLGYVCLGQYATTLSGGEAQRIKLTKELSKKNTGRTLYILDEPTTGLHFEDINKLIYVLNKLVDAGSTVVVIEHNLDVIKTADHIIDLGPEGGDAGGKILAIGTPEEVAANEKSYTGQFLKEMLKL